MKTNPELTVLQRKTIILCNFCIILHLLGLAQKRREQTTMSIRLSVICLSFHMHFPCCSAAEEADLMDAFLLSGLGLGRAVGSIRTRFKGGRRVPLGLSASVPFLKVLCRLDVFSKAFALF